MSWEIRQGDALDRLREIPDESVQCCVTSPPYWGLRDYGTASWDGGDPDCDHRAPLPGGKAASGLGDYDNGLNGEAIAAKVDQRRQQYRGECRSCGATRVDNQLGLEATPEQYVANMVAVFAEVRRALRNDGTLWLNLGDSYARFASGRNGNFGRCAKGIGLPEKDDSRRVAPGLKHKDLVGIPWRVALALQADGWYLRSDVIWSKPNPMPESITDRPTKAHEYLFLLTKSPRYFYDAAAIREADVGGDHPRHVLSKPDPTGGLMAAHQGIRTSGGRNGQGRNKRSVWKVPEDLWAQFLAWYAEQPDEVRSVWDIATRPYPDAHFATFPPQLVEPCILAGAPGGGIGA